MAIRLNCNRSNALDWSVINYWGLKLFLRDHNLALGSAVVPKHTSYSVQVKQSKKGQNIHCTYPLTIKPYKIYWYGETQNRVLRMKTIEVISAYSD